ncbi:MAG: UDP-glucose 4-epimerase GalE [Saprospiraceae bacterium]|nr:UDP-glucose 4-epimerase GalE [Saprospiraceae bacterium]
MKKKVLVTGGTGYIGSHTLIDLIENGYDVVCADNGCNSDTSSLLAIEKITGVKVPYFHIDLCDLSGAETIFKSHPDIQGVIHFAALKAVGESVEKPIQYFRNNIDSLINTLDLCLKYDVKAFIFSSSCTVYGDVSSSPVDENTPLQEAASPYGRTKQIGEQIITDTIKNKSLKSILLRYFNPAGAHPSGHLGESPINPPQNLVPVITETAIGKRNSMTVYGDDYPTRDGSCVRDYIHVCDLAHAHTLALNYIFEGLQSIQTEIFNVGIGNGLTVLEIIRAFEKVSGEKLNYQIGGRRPGDIMAIYSDYRKAKNLLGWNPKYNVNDIMHTAWLWEKNRSNPK